MFTGQSIHVQFGGRPARWGRVVVLCMLGSVPSAGGQPATAPAAPAQPAATRPAVDVTPLLARVVEVEGNVAWGPAEADVLDADAWTPVRVDDELASGSQIRTGLRSYVVLTFGDDTVVSIRRATLASIDAFYKTHTQQTIKLGLGYGAVRGGTTEGTLRSEVLVDSPVATLAKRGTEGWEIQVEPYTGRFRISLARSGLVEALQKFTGQRRLVYPGQYADNVNIARAWVNQAIFDQTITFVSPQGLTNEDVDFITRIEGGYAPISAGSAYETLEYAGRASRFTAPLGSRVDPALVAGRALALSVLFNTVIARPSAIGRPEGNFGVPGVEYMVAKNELRRMQRRLRGR